LPENSYEGLVIKDREISIDIWKDMKDKEEKQLNNQCKKARMMMTFRNLNLN